MKFMTFVVTFLAVSAISVLAHTAPRAKAETRCGWVANPTPGNWWLNDKAGEWIIGVQGGYQADGDGLPDLSEHDWVVTNAGGHGYGCACVTGVYDRKTMQVVRIDSTKQKTIRQCKADKTLKKPN